MKSKWASCSRNGWLTFNSEILQQPANFRREAIVHELLHLKVPNHGKLFKNFMKSYLSSETGFLDIKILESFGGFLSGKTI